MAKEQKMNRIQGLNCYLEYEIGIRLETREKINRWFKWRTVGNLNGTEKEQIAYFLSAELPNENFHSECSTLDQAIYWLEAKDWAILVAHAFLETPLISKIKDVVSDPYLDYIHLSAKYYQNLWDLLKIRWTKISPRLSPINGQKIENKLDLIKLIIAAEVDGNFAICLKPQHQINYKEDKELATLSYQSRRRALLPNEQQRIEKMKQKSVAPNPGLNQLMAACQSLFKKDSVISSHLIIHAAIKDGLCKLTQNDVTQGRASSYTWIDGYRNPGLVWRSACGEIRKTRA
jgi:hypothetical protein